MPISSQELLHRQVHPNFVRDGRLTSQAFRPNGQDGGKLSVDRGSLVTAEGAYHQYVAGGRSSCGVWSVTAGECETCGVQAREDALEHNPAHALIDFNHLPSKGHVERTAKKLAHAAQQRGCQFAPSFAPPG